MSRQIFELDDNRVRVLCRPQFSGNRPPGFHPPGGQGVCCRPGNIYPTPPSTSTTKFDTETFPPDDYDTYTGTGTGSYTGGDEDYYEYGRLHGVVSGKPGNAKNGKVSPAQQQKQQKMVRTFTNNPSGTMATTKTPHKRNKRERNRVRSLRHKDVVVSFVEWQRRRAQSNQF